MSDHIDPDKVRELANLHRKWGEEVAWAPKIKNTHTQIAEILESLLLTPPLPTIAELIEKGCNPEDLLWLQAKNEEGRIVVITYIGTSRAHLLHRDGLSTTSKLEKITPLVNKPRLVWPDEFNPETGEEAPTPEVHPKVLTTEGDYRNAPEGTIVAAGMGVSFYTSTWTWHTIGGVKRDHCDLAGTPRSVLRWGMGEQA